MPRLETDIVIIGAGCVGLAIAARLSDNGKSITVVERHSTCGYEASSRNSEVIHGGMYYPTGTLKARFCVEGNARLYEICEQYQIPFRKTGKLIIAREEAERLLLEEIMIRGKINGVPGLRMLSSAKIRELEPAIRTRYALYSPASGILDAVWLMKHFEDLAKEQGVHFRYQNEVVGLEKLSRRFELTLRTGNGTTSQILADWVINAAGLGADVIAALADIDRDAAGYRIHYCKGEYFNVDRRHAGCLNHMIYPTPSEISLGIHTRLRLDGSFALGPDAIYVDHINYDVDPDQQAEFFDSCRQYLPFLKREDLSPDIVGVRAKLQGPNGSFRDFVIRHEADRGLPGLVNLIGIDSPGLTACPAIAEYVCDMLHQAD